MIRHISIFFLKENVTDEEKARALNAARHVGDGMDSISDCRVGADCMDRPPKGLPGLPEFGDLVQVIDFKTREAAEGFASHPAHLKEMEQINDLVAKVVAVDFEI